MLTRFFHRRRWDEERVRELRAYLEIETDENIARGMPPEEARYAAHRKLGNPTSIREEIYRMNTLTFVETFWQDLRFGARLLRLNPGFSIVAIFSLALGIGANTAIFQLIDAVRLRTLPVPNPQELAEIRIGNTNELTGIVTGSTPEMTNPLWEQIRDHRQGFSGMFAWGDEDFNLAEGGQVRYAKGVYVSGDFFNVLGIHPILGRVFTPADDRRGCGSSGAVISYAFWQREFGGSAKAAGRKLMLDRHPFEVLGVTPPGFSGLEVGRSFDVAVPLCSAPNGEDQSLNRRDVWWLSVMGRLKPGWSLTRVSAYLDSISPALLQETAPPGYGASSLQKYLGFRLRAFPASTGVSWLRTQYTSSLSLLLAIAALVLLIACANLANLMLARASAREREVAVRLAIGASRGRIIRQFLAESSVLAAIGAVLAAFLAQGLSRVLVSFLSTQGDALSIDMNLDWRVLGFTAALALVTCLLFGLTPALKATRTTPGAVMKSGGRGLTASRERFGLRRILAVSQVALSLVLLVGALLFSRSLRNLLTLDTGFRQDGILIATFNLGALDPSAGKRQTLTPPLLLDRIRILPGVESAAATSTIPIRGGSWTLGVRVHDSDQERRGASKFTWVSPDYFRTMETPLLAGRDFDRRDTATSPKVAIINELFARRYFNGANPIGKTFVTEAEPNYPATVYQIVGLVKNTAYFGLRDEFKPIAFAAASQFARYPTEFVIRSNAPLSSLTSSVKTAVAEINPGISIDFDVFKARILDSLVPERLMATLSGFFGFLAAVLATIGLYGVISYMVARRRNEIGIRIALGADRGDVLRMVLKEAGMLLVIGLAAGIALALALSRTASSMLFGLKPYDPLTMILAASILAIVALAASYLPARRAASLDPMAALRDE